METTFRMIVDQLLPDCIDPLIPENKDVQQSCIRVAAYQLALCFSQWQQNRLQEAEESAHLALQWLPAAEELEIQALRAESMHALGIIKFLQGALVQALTFYQQAGDLYQVVDYQISFGTTLLNQNVILQNTGKFDAAEKLQNSVQQFAAQTDDPGYFARVKWNELGKLATIRGQLDEAEAYFDKSLEQFTDLTYRPLFAYVVRERGELSRLKGDYAEAKNYAQRSIALADEINMPHPIIQSLWLLGNIAVDEGRFETALHYFAEYEQISTPLQEQIGGPGWALLGLSRLGEARQQFAVSVQRMIDNQARPIGLDALVGMAHIKARTGQLEQALELLALVKQHPSSHFESREKARKLWEELVAEIPAELIAEVEVRSREMDLWQTAESLLAEVKAVN